MTLPNWVVALSDTIQDASGLDSSRESAREWLPDLIAKHLPRCDGCKHWSFAPDYKPPAGTCALQNGPQGKVSSDCGDWTIYTEADFGCVQWEAK